jgi:hypothetical protein
MSKPVQLFRFSEDETIWTVTSANKAQMYNGENYTHVNIGRNRIKSSSDSNSKTVEVSVDFDNPMGKRWLTTVLDTNVSLVIYRIDSGIVTIESQGKLSGTKTEDNKIILVFDSSTFDARGAVVQKTCSHVHYGRGCFKNKADVAVAGTVLTVSDSVVTVDTASSKPEGYFNAGMIADSSGVLRFITSHVGTVLTLSRALSSLTVCMSVNLYPGCPRTTTACKDIFDNLPNHGGYPWIPSIDPYDGTPIA